MLIGTKSDLEVERRDNIVTTNNNQLKSDKIDLVGVCKALDCTNVNEILEQFVRAIIKRKREEGPPKPFNFEPSTNNQSFFGKIISFFKGN